MRQIARPALILLLTVFGVMSFSAHLFAKQNIASYAESDPEQFKKIANQLRCPTCTGLSVLDSSAGFSEQIKAQVGEQLKLGKSEQEILDFFVERYGPWILREPPTQGFNLLAWALPIGLLILGPFAIWYTVWRKRVDVSSYGVRRVELIVDQMDAELSALRERQR
jgi:cytochrome c-type biogenesis protein CcmH